MKDKYKKYIDYIASDIELPYLKYLNMYGLKQDEMNMVLGIVFNQPVFYIKSMHGVYNKNRDKIYVETTNGIWCKYGYDNNGNIIYYEYSNGFWCKREYDDNGNKIYYEDSSGIKREYERQI